MADEATMAYITAVVALAQREDIDWYIPVSHTLSAVYDAEIAKRLLSTKASLRSLSPCDPDLVAKLDNKWEFTLMGNQANVAVPSTFLLENVERLQALHAAGTFDGRRYFLKPINQFSQDRTVFRTIPGRIAGSEKRDNLFGKFVSHYRNKITPETPYLATEFLVGPEYSCNVIARRGRVIALSISKSSQMQIDYEVVDSNAITEWVNGFVNFHRLTGSFCFDFIACTSGPEASRTLCIECNPRTHSSLVLYQGSPRVEKAIFRALEPEADGRQVLPDERLPLRPDPTTPHVYWIYNEVGKVFRQESDLFNLMKLVVYGKEAIFDLRDPAPFFALYCVQMPEILYRQVLNPSPWRVTNVCMGGIRY